MVVVIEGVFLYQLGNYNIARTLLNATLIMNHDPEARREMTF